MKMLTIYVSIGCALWFAPPGALAEQTKIGQFQQEYFSCEANATCMELTKRVWTYISEIPKEKQKQELRDAASIFAYYRVNSKPPDFNDEAVEFLLSAKMHELLPTVISIACSGIDHSHCNGLFSQALEDDVRILRATVIHNVQGQTVVEPEIEKQLKNVTALFELIMKVFPGFKPTPELSNTILLVMDRRFDKVSEALWNLYFNSPLVDFAYRNFTEHNFFSFLYMDLNQGVLSKNLEKIKVLLKRNSMRMKRLLTLPENTFRYNDNLRLALHDLRNSTQQKWEKDTMTGEKRTILEDWKSFLDDFNEGKHREVVTYFSKVTHQKMLSAFPEKSTHALSDLLQEWKEYIQALLDDMNTVSNVAGRKLPFHPVLIRQVIEIDEYIDIEDIDDRSLNGIRDLRQENIIGQVYHDAVQQNVYSDDELDEKRQTIVDRIHKFGNSQYLSFSQVYGLVRRVRRFNSLHPSNTLNGADLVTVVLTVFKHVQHEQDIPLYRTLTSSVKFLLHSVHEAILTSPFKHEASHALKHFLLSFGDKPIDCARIIRKWHRVEYKYVFFIKGLVLDNDNEKRNALRLDLKLDVCLGHPALMSLGSSAIESLPFKSYWESDDIHQHIHDDGLEALARATASPVSAQKLAILEQRLARRYHIRSSYFDQNIDLLKKIVRIDLGFNNLRVDPANVFQRRPKHLLEVLERILTLIREAEARGETRSHITNELEPSFTLMDKEKYMHLPMGTASFGQEWGRRLESLRLYIGVFDYFRLTPILLEQFDEVQEQSKSWSNRHLFEEMFRLHDEVLQLLKRPEQNVQE